MFHEVKHFSKGRLELFVVFVAFCLVVSEVTHQDLHTVSFVGSFIASRRSQKVKGPEVVIPSTRF